MLEKKHVVVVCGYGCHLDTPLKPYLDRIAQFIEKSKPFLIIFCGGATQKKTAHGVTEARLMARYVLSKLSFKPSFVEVEETSYTTFKNINQASKIINRNLAWKDESQITIFCEATRSANIIMLARHFMTEFVDSIDNIKVETDSWERADPFKQVWNLIYNKLALKLPYLAEREQKRRIRRSEFI